MSFLYFEKFKHFFPLHKRCEHRNFWLWYKQFEKLYFVYIINTRYHNNYKIRTISFISYMSMPLYKIIVIFRNYILIVKFENELPTIWHIPIPILSNLSYCVWIFTELYIFPLYVYLQKYQCTDYVIFYIMKVVSHFLVFVHLITLNWYLLGLAILGI